jgi:hypothetical protein
MSDDPIQAAIDSIGKKPEGEVTLAAVAEQHGPKGVVLEGVVDVGKPGGFVVGGQAGIKTTTGWSFAALVKWKRGK